VISLLTCREGFPEENLSVPSGQVRTKEFSNLVSLPRQQVRKHFRKPSFDKKRNRFYPFTKKEYLKK